MSDFEDVFEYFQHPVHHLNRHEAVAYVAWCLLHLPLTECYPTSFIGGLPQRFPGMEISDTVLSATLNRFEAEALVVYQRAQQEGGRRGRPRKVYQVNSEQRQKVKRLSDLWTATHLTAELQRA